MDHEPLGSTVEKDYRDRVFLIKGLVKTEVKDEYWLLRAWIEEDPYAASYHMPEISDVESDRWAVVLFDDNYHLGINWYRSMFPTKYEKQRITQKFVKLYLQILNHYNYRQVY